MIRKVLFIAFVVMSSLSGMAQDKTFTMEDLSYGGKNYLKMTPARRNFAWWGNELVRLDVEKAFIINKVNGKEKVLFTLEQLKNALPSDVNSAGINPLRASFPYADKSQVMVANAQYRMLYDFKAKKIVWKQKAEGTLEWNASSKTDAFLRDDNLWLRMEDGMERQLTTDGSREIVYAQSVHRDEFGITKGTFWSPDGQKLAFYRMDQSMVDDYPQVNTFGSYAKHEPDKYPMAGGKSHKVTIGVYDLKEGRTIYLKAGDPTDRYFTNIAWSPDCQSVYLIELNRGQDKASLDRYNAATGDKQKTLYTEEDKKYVEPLHPITFLPWDKSQYVMWSQKDGFMHLYLCDAETGSIKKQLTKGSWVVMDIVGFCQQTKSIIIQANKDSHIQKNLYSVNVATGEITSLDNGNGVHGALLSADGEFVVDAYQEPDVPRAYCLSKTTKVGKSLTLFTAPNPWEGYAIPQFRHGTIKAADGVTDLHYRMVLPADFDETKKYPTVVYVYGGPHAHNVDASWHYLARPLETYMAQKGYIMFILDNRGSENRGKEFEQVTFRQLGQVEMQDQMKGVDYLRTLPYIDMNRLGVHGWSFGGYMTITLMTNNPGVFKAGVAGGPVIDWHWYEVMYGERYMDTPQENPEGYAKTSLIAKAKDLKDKLQIITGMNDATVVPQHSLKFIYECNIKGTQPDFYVYPGEPHNMRGHQAVHLAERIAQYFDDYLAPLTPEGGK